MMMVTTMQAANYDNWHPFILIAGILAFFAAGVFILGTWKVLNMIVDLSMTSVISMAILVVWMFGDEYDASRIFIVIAKVILIKIVTVVSLQESTFASGGKNKAVKKISIQEKSSPLDHICCKVREAIYILGLGVPGKRPSPVGEEPLPPSEASSIISIFGFGHDGSGKWTFAGRRQVSHPTCF